MARLLPNEEWERAAKLLKKKYWLARIPSWRRKDNVYLEIEVLPGG